MDVQRRRLERMAQIGDQENVGITGKAHIAVPVKKVGAKVRGALGELNSNVQVQRDANINTATSIPEKKECFQRQASKSSYSHIQSKIDTGLSAKPVVLSHIPKPTLRREESTASHATRAARVKVAVKENLKNKEKVLEKKATAPKSRNVEPTEKKVDEIKPSTYKLYPKEDVVSLACLKLVDTCREQEAALPDDIEDIDYGDETSPFLMSAYIKDIYKYLIELEDKYPIEPDYLRNQKYINGKMRATLIDWLVEVRNQFHVSLETLQLCVGTIDRYLQAQPDIRTSELQLVGVTCMFIACKYEEVLLPEITDFVVVSDDAFTKRDIICCERTVISKLGFSLAKPIPLSFLRRFMKAAHGSAVNHHLAKYFVDLSLIEYSMVHYKPSELAAAAVCLSMYILSSKKLHDVWTPTLQYYSSYKLEDIEPIMKKMAKLALTADSANHKAVYNSYKSSSLARVALLPQLKNTSMVRLARSCNNSPTP
ncbi:hypothetical protein EVAR_18688_1 [Eumeta japonica]|uniref:G2/mitotic-specific cyclin-B n=1 Tax=Eumeta variegata TaxID=151549 RepID=A0A4C1U7H7_EUMVA|nr:hypothetical protein EVAR_18688_1 [Eumeta japonica]